MYHTAQDLIEYLMASVGGGAQDSEHRALRTAVQNGYRDVIYSKDWNWHVSRMQLPPPEPGSNNKVYVLPPVVKDVDALIPPNRATRVAFVTPNEWQRLEAYGLSTGEPLYWTFMPCLTKPDRWEIRLAGNPSSINPTLAYWITYRRKPEPLKYMGYEPACRNGSLNETNAFGRVKRYGTSANFPEGAGGVHPYTAEEILGVPGSFLGDPPPPQCKTTVSDRLDISDGMLSAVQASCECWLAKLLGKNIEGALTVYARELRLAFENDTFASIAGRRTGTSRYPENAAPPLAANSLTPTALGYYSPSAPDDPGTAPPSPQ